MTIYSTALLKQISSNIPIKLIAIKSSLSVKPFQLVESNFELKQFNVGALEHLGFPFRCFAASQGDSVNKKLSPITPPSDHQMNYQITS